MWQRQRWWQQQQVEAEAVVGHTCSQNFVHFELFFEIVGQNHYRPLCNWCRRRHSSPRHQALQYPYSTAQLVTKIASELFIKAGDIICGVRKSRIPINKQHLYSSKRRRKAESEKCVKIDVNADSVCYLSVGHDSACLSHCVFLPVCLTASLSDCVSVSLRVSPCLSHCVFSFSLQVLNQIAPSFCICHCRLKKAI